MSRTPDRLYALLPAVHRARDGERGEPLRALLHVINEQVDRVEDDIARLYENWFIETCEDWVVPYLGDLIGYTPVSVPEAQAGEASARTAQRTRLLVPRKEVAKTLGFRRRKGTLALLELLANDVAGWPARAVEFYALLGWTQHINHQRLLRGRTVDLRDDAALDRLGGPFERLAHTVDVRRIGSSRTRGRFNIPTVGVFVWRLKAYSVTHAPASCIESEGPHCFTLSALGHDQPLYTHPEPEPEPTHIAGELELPVAIGLRTLEERVSERPLKTQTAAAYYGAGKSLAIYAPDWPMKGAPQPVPREAIVPADLTDWQYRATRGQIGIDPERGRLVFPTNHLPRRGVWVTYHYAFSADMGGGEYPRTLNEPRPSTLYKVTKEPKEVAPAAAGKATAKATGKAAGSAAGNAGNAAGKADEQVTFGTIGAALAAWRDAQQALGPAPQDDDTSEDAIAWREAHARLRAAVIEIQDSAVYAEPLSIALDTGESLEIRAASRWRPIIRLLDYQTSGSDALTITGKAGSRFSLDGIVVSGRGVNVRGPDRYDAYAVAAGDLCEVQIRHCTLVPGWGLECDCEPQRPNEPSLELFNTSAHITIEHSILGSIFVVADEVRTDPVCITITDSIVDATSNDRVAIGAPSLPFAFAVLTIARTTVFGAVHTHAIASAENAIFMGEIAVARRQLGCMRFCYVTPGSRTPRRYRCQPDAVRAAVDEIEPPLSAPERALYLDRETNRVRPIFTSSRYGEPAYAQLAIECAVEITRGADDESEMGAFHDLFQPQREANLRVRLQEFTPAGMEADIVFAN
jgi:hypothetical protein